MQNAETVLGVIRERGRRVLPCNDTHGIDHWRAGCRTHPAGPTRRPATRPPRRSPPRVPEGRLTRADGVSGTRRLPNTVAAHVSSALITNSGYCSGRVGQSQPDRRSS